MSRRKPGVVKTAKTSRMFSPNCGEKLTSMTSPWPFAQWGVGLIGPLPKGQGGARYAILAIDYFMKWIKVEALSSITKKKTTDSSGGISYANMRFPILSLQIMAGNLITIASENFVRT